MVSGRNFVHFFFKNETETTPETDHVAHVIEEVVNLARQLDLEVNGDDVNELLDSHSQELTIDELIEMREQNVTESDTSDPVPPEKHMTIASLTEGLSSIEKGLKILENIDSNEERVIATKQGIKKLLACYEEILCEKKKALCRQTNLLDFMKPSTSKYSNFFT